MIPRKGRPGKAHQAHEHGRAFCGTLTWRTGSEARISTLERGYRWDRTHLDDLEGARIWAGQGSWAINLVKINTIPPHHPQRIDSARSAFFKAK